MFCLARKGLPTHVSCVCPFYLIPRVQLLLLTASAVREMGLSHGWWSGTDGPLCPLCRKVFSVLWGGFSLPLSFCFISSILHFKAILSEAFRPPHSPSSPHTHSFLLKAKVSKLSVLVMPDRPSRPPDVLETPSQILKQKRKGAGGFREGSVVRSVCCVTEGQRMGVGFPAPTQWLKTQLQGT